MKLIIPMAGQGRRLNGAYGKPKPLVEVAGRPMIYWALKSFEGMSFTEVVFVVLEEHVERHGIGRVLSELVPRMRLVAVPHTTEGQLCSVLAARDYLDCDEGVLIASCDTYVKSTLKEDIACSSEECEGIISVIDLPGERWSFARTDGTGRVVEVAEKKRISNRASTGLYYFARGRTFLQAADKVISAGRKTRGEYYVIMVYQEYLARGARIEIAHAEEMWDMGTPEAIAQFERSVKCI